MIRSDEEIAAVLAMVQAAPRGRVFVEGREFCPVEMEKQRQTEIANQRNAAVARANKKLGTLYRWETFQVGESREFAPPETVAVREFSKRLGVSYREWGKRNGHRAFSSECLPDVVRVTRIA